MQIFHTTNFRIIWIDLLSGCNGEKRKISKTPISKLRYGMEDRLDEGKLKSERLNLKDEGHNEGDTWSILRLFTSLTPKQDKQSSWQSTGKQLREANKQTKHQG